MVDVVLLEVDDEFDDVEDEVELDDDPPVEPVELLPVPPVPLAPDEAFPPVDAELPVPLADEPLPDEPVCDFAALTSVLRLSFDDSSINPMRIVEPVASLSFGTAKVKRARPRGVSASRIVMPPKCCGS